MHDHVFVLYMKSVMTAECVLLLCRHVEYFDWKSAQTALNQLTGTQMYRKPIELRKVS